MAWKHLLSDLLLAALVLLLIALAYGIFSLLKLSRRLRHSFPS